MRTQWTIEIAKALPSYNTYEKMHYRTKKRLKDLWYTLVMEAVHGLTFKKIPTPVTLRGTVYHKLQRRRDILNMGTTLDKLVVDALTKPSESQPRGLGLLPDDDYKSIREVTLSLKKGEADATILVFRRYHGN